MKAVFLGGANEVGRQAILIDVGERFLFDYGVNVQTMAHPIEAPLPIKAIFLSHAHLDHSGHLPCLYKRGCNAELFLTPTTYELSLILLKDSIKVQKKKGMIPHYSYDDIERMQEFVYPIFYKQKVEFDNASFEFRDAGHISGSAAILMETNRKKILFTGDIKFEPTRLLDGADQDFENIDILISETTYSYKNHPNRKQLTEQLKKDIRATIEAGGIVILPCFAVGRTQEMLIILAEMDMPFWVDGMGIEATFIVLNHPESQKNPVVLKQAFDRARKVRKPADRATAISRPGIIVASAGMLQGGPIHWYLKRL
ncbi:MAG: MBL fold metallo-hydrolase, partial [Candidatus Aenigmatarchaeota archaeon]